MSTPTEKLRKVKPWGEPRQVSPGLWMTEEQIQEAKHGKVPEGDGLRPETPTEKVRIMTRSELESARRSGAKVRQLNHGTFSVNSYVYRIEELESKVEEVREQEAQAKARLAQAVVEQKQARINYLRQAVGTYRRMLLTANSTASSYAELFRQNERYVTITRFIGELLVDENEHARKLQAVISQLEQEQRMLATGVPVKEWKR